MKKVLSVLTVALFLAAITVPVVAQDPPKKDKEKTECSKKCTKADSTKCTKNQKAGCCAGDKKADSKK
jgi:hypothetical protein